MRIRHPVATLKEITPCLSVSYSLYELPTTGLACRVFGDFLAAFWAPIDCGRRRVGRMEEPDPFWCFEIREVRWIAFRAALFRY